MKTPADLTVTRLREHVLDVARENARVIIAGRPERAKEPLTYFAQVDICRFGEQLELTADANCGAGTHRMVGIEIPAYSVLLAVQGDETRGNVREIALLTPEGVEYMPRDGFEVERIRALIEIASKFVADRAAAVIL